MSGMRSRAKGARGELEVAKLLRSWGYDCDRVPNSGGLKWKGDVLGMDGFHIEVKRTERLRLGDAVLQAAQDAEQGQVPLVVHRSNNQPWLVTLPLGSLLSLLEGQPQDQADAPESA